MARAYTKGQVVKLKVSVDADPATINEYHWKGASIPAGTSITLFSGRVPKVRISGRCGCHSPWFVNGNTEDGHTVRPCVCQVTA